jgi:hypothetical protein
MLFGRSETTVAVPSPEEQLSSEHVAIQLARQGRIPVKDMLESLVAGRVFVPLAAPPQIDGDAIRSWNPATVSKADGSQWLVAFTNAQLAAQFTKQNSHYSHGIQVSTRWVLEALPPACGLAVNIGEAESMFEWSADGLCRYKKHASAQSAS